MAKHNPVLDSAAFTVALTNLVLRERQAYRALVLFLFEGLNLDDIGKDMDISYGTARRLVSRAKTIIREELANIKPELLDIAALASKQEEDLIAKELKEIDIRFPFVDPYKIMS